jgi:hypothetical protein
VASFSKKRPPESKDGLIPSPVPGDLENVVFSLWLWHYTPIVKFPFLKGWSEKEA